jgi:Tfp pilus assembly pilus retraction ATPase PilT
VAAVEIMISTATVVGYIRDPAKTGEIKDYLEKSSGTMETQSFDQHIARLIQGGQITEQVGLEAATNPSDLQRAMHFE